MPAFEVTVPHGMGKDQALQRLKTFLETIGERYKDQVSKLEGSWEENVLTFSMTTFGFTISGKMAVEETVARMEGQLPFAAVAFKGKIVKSIGDEISKQLTG